jgi:hypothetical protein
MRSRVTVERPHGEVLTDLETGVVSRALALVYKGPAYLRYPGLGFATEPQDARAGMDPASTRPVVHLPLWADVEPQDKITVVWDRDNRCLAGLRLEAVSTDAQSQGSGLRVVCRDWLKGVADAVP